jgi:hypothetical protein
MLVYLYILIAAIIMMLVTRIVLYRRLRRPNYRREGFLNPLRYPVGVTDHARQRFCERLNVCHFSKMDKITRDAYKYGKSSMQLTGALAKRLENISSRYGDNIALLYRGSIYVFSPDNSLITLYKKDGNNEPYNKEI